jgi:hypothetical protein
MSEVVSRIGRPTRAYVLPAVWAGVALVAYLASTLLHDVYYGIPDSIPVSTIAASCEPGTGRATCDVVIVRLNPGRFYVSTVDRASTLTVVATGVGAIVRPNVVLVRPEVRGGLSVDGYDGAATASARDGETRQAGERVLIDVRADRSRSQRITFRAASADASIVISELGFFADGRALLPPAGRLFDRVSTVSFYSTYAAMATLLVCAFVAAAAWLAPGALARPAPWIVGSLCVAICVLDLGTMFSPHWSRDIRSMYGAELVHSGANGNLTGGLYEGSRILQGLGQTTEADTVSWHRMPGYGLLCAFAGVVGRTTDVVEIAMVVILLQTLLYGAAVGIFVCVARRMFGVPIACLLGLLIALLPKQLNYTEVDSIIAPICLLVLSAIIALLATRPLRQPPSLRPWIVVNAAFAMWFLMRNDVLPGWFVVSAALAGWHWRGVVVPLTLVAAIALPWALYKRQYRHEFNLMPTNAGEVLFLSLCEVPGAFPYECTDAGYIAWANRFSGGAPSSQRASNLAITEVVRHWVTYPVHFAFMVVVKLRRCVIDESWPGFRTRLSALYSGFLRQGLFACLLTLVAVSIAVDHQRRRSMLLGWPLLLNMPIFLIVFDSAGRFYAAAAVSLIVAAVPLLFERGFASQVRRHPFRGAIVLGCVVLFVLGGPRVEGWVQTHDSLHYWAPLLDPGRSTLQFRVAR